jgi:hypothetical protein
MLTPDAKDALRRTIRSLRERLAADLRAEAETTYQLARADASDLSESAAARRERLLAHVDEHVRSAPAAELKKGRAAVKERVLARFVLEAAHTLVNRLVLLRHMEALSANKPRAERLVAIDVITKGWQSPAYRAWREHAHELCEDATEGYAALLGLVFAELAHDLPGLFGDVGLTRLFPVPARTLRDLIEALNHPALESAWTDDTTLGWIYQYWNDPERERLDAKINDGQKIEPHEIASKTQMFTERYMVEWLLQNSLGLTWLAMCRKHGWKPEADEVLGALDARRAEWRAKREANEVALDALMPIQGGLEDRWKYWVPQPIPDDAVEKAPASIRELKLLDPACGSGHFLVIAFDLLAALYQEEARHRGEAWSAKQIAEWIIENNLHGVDIDPRAVQIAAAGLFVKWRTLSHEARPRQVNLVAPALHLGRLPENDPALVQLRKRLAEEAHVPEAVTTKLLRALADVDHLGTLLKVDRAIEEALRPLGERSLESVQGSLFGGMPAAQAKLDLAGAKTSVLERIEEFLGKHGAEGDLGLRLDGEEVAAGLRFLRIVREDAYDIVVGNPPYQGTAKMADAAYVARQYPDGRTDLFAAFLVRGLQLARASGLCGMLTMRNWMFLSTFEALRTQILRSTDLRSLADLGTGAFSSRSMDDVITAAMAITRRCAPAKLGSLAIQAAPLIDPTRDAGKPARRAAALLAHVGRFEFDVEGFAAIGGEPIVYWWPNEFLRRYAEAPKLGELAPARFGVNTGDNGRFVRKIWEIRRPTLVRLNEPIENVVRGEVHWAPYIKGSAGREWIDPVSDVVTWASDGLQLKVSVDHNFGNIAWKIPNESFYFGAGVAFAKIGAQFSARAHRVRSVIDNAGSSVYPADVATTVCLLNSSITRWVLSSLNPSVNFTVGDVNRLPVLAIDSADAIYASLERAFAQHEAARETSSEFRSPGASTWASAQLWAQHAVDRPAGDPLSPNEPVLEGPESTDYLSYAIGVALGRFSANGDGILDIAPPTALPHGILFASSLNDDDSLAHPACAQLHAAWAEHGAAVAGHDDLRTWLRTKLFADHRARYENRPIYFPLSSEKRSFVAWISIHRWQHDTLQVLLADHLSREEARLQGQLADLNRARSTPEAGTKKADAEKRYRDVQRLADELAALIAQVRLLAEEGPPPTDDKCPKREIAARFAMDLDDGVMVNSAALWPLLEPQWKDPKKWWKELASAQGRKDYDWSHLAARYFPSRVEKKCHEDPSLAVAHKCFWRLHPAKAYAWELRLQDELRADFTIEQPGSDEARAAFLRDKPQEAETALRAEETRRARKKAKADAGAQEEIGVDGEGEPAEENADG